mmetsp:Transcript_60502/g.88595  ORF Transcript_60502/g.88595 Transcript_60502/m.88595 type:complete len:148 (+) Transcript_60502:146-589(+)
MLRSAPRVLGKFAAAAAAGGAALVATAQTARTDGDIMHPVEYPWSHNGVMHAYDAASIRRGHQVYAEVCAACHGLKRVAYRNLVGVCYTEDEAKEMAADKEYPDGPDDTGQFSCSVLVSSIHVQFLRLHQQQQQTAYEQVVTFKPCS